MPPRDLVNIPEVGNARYFGEALLAKDPWYGPRRGGIINIMNPGLFRGDSRCACQGQKKKADSGPSVV